MKSYLQKKLPKPLWQILRQGNHIMAHWIRRLFEYGGLIVSKKADFYSTASSISELAKTRSRWNKPSSLGGLKFDLDKMEKTLDNILIEFFDDLKKVPPYEQMVKSGYGPGYPLVDALVLFCMLRHHKPSRYLEIGSGLSTAYAQKALQLNETEGAPGSITCVEPYPYDKLKLIPGITLLQTEVQNVSMSKFEELKSDDFLFIDSSHAVKIDSDVSFLILEVLPALKPGVIIHIHDIPFPYNIPYPAEYWTLLENEQSPHWPVFWNEAMLVQAFLSGNSEFRILLSLPLLRYYREESLKSKIPFYKTIREAPNTFSSLWLQKI